MDATDVWIGSLKRNGVHEMKIAVISARFAISGVPLAQLRLAKALVGKGHSVDLIYGFLIPGNTFPKAAGISIIEFGKPRVIKMLPLLIQYLKAEKPEIIFSAGDHLNVIVLIAAILSRSTAKISCSSRVTPFDTYSSVPFTKRWLLKQIMLATEWRADVLTCVSKDMVKQYQQLFPFSRHTCVYNIVERDTFEPCLAAFIDEPWLTSKSGPMLVAAGSLVPWKGFVDLINAMSFVVKKSDAKLIILGDGPMRNELEDLILALGLGGAIKLLGSVEDPLIYFSRCEVFVLSSYVEGLPNVLVEAMMCGCTPVSTNCPTGPSEVLGRGEFGYLVPVGVPSALADGILAAIDRPIPRQSLSEAIQPFTTEAVLSAHFGSLGI